MTHDELIEILASDDEIVETSLQWEDIDDLKHLISLIINKAAKIQDKSDNLDGDMLHLLS